MQKKHLILLIKLTVIAAAFALIYHKTDTAQIGHYLTSIHPMAIIVAYLLLVAAQVASAFRTQHYFRAEGLPLNNRFAVGLYFTGMMYNTILPGGIGGDAYKIFLVGKLAKFSKVTALRLLLSDRASGLFILMMLAFCFTIALDLSALIPHANLLVIFGIAITIPGYFISTRILLKERATTAIGALPYSLIVQLSGIGMIVAILMGLGVDISNLHQTNGYILLFLVSSVLAVLPISIGGVGIREVAFLIGAKLLGLDAELGIAIAMIFFLVTLICSLNGLFFWHKLERLYVGRSS